MIGTAFGGKVAGRNFGVSPETAARFDVTKLHPLLEALHERLASVVIECLPWAEAIRRYDRAKTLFYLDPPYWGSEGDYGKDLFGREDFDALAAQLAGIKGQFILSINDTPEIRQIFAAFTVEDVETTYTLAGNNKPKKAGELIVSGSEETLKG